VNAPAYRHAQIGWWLVAWAVLWIALCAAIGTRLFGGTVLAVILAIAGAAFARLSIRVEDGTLAWSMTFGFPAGRIAVSDIVETTIVPVTLLRGGIGIHGYPGRWLWNVALGQGVSVQKADGNVVILGSDEPQALLDAIERARAAA
jgi:hypothetical protein